jgi:hypothetical protein
LFYLNSKTLTHFLQSIRFTNLFFSFPTGITLTLSTLVDGKNFNAGGHKIGVALELEA